MSRSADTITAPAAGSLLAERRSSPGLLLAMLGHVAMRRLRDAHLALSITPRQFVLLGLLHEHGPTAQTELGTMLGTDPSILVTMLNPLEDDRLVSRRRDPQDRRRHLVTLTAAGERKLTRAAQAQREAEDGLFAAFDDDQREQLRTLLVELSEALPGMPCCPAAADECSPPTAVDYRTTTDRSPS